MKKRILDNFGFSQVFRYISFGILLALLGIITTACQNIIIADNSDVRISGQEDPEMRYRYR